MKRCAKECKNAGEAGTGASAQCQLSLSSDLLEPPAEFFPRRQAQQLCRSARTRVSAWCKPSPSSFRSEAKARVGAKRAGAGTAPLGWWVRHRQILRIGDNPRIETDKNEGEGSRSGDERHRQGVERTIREGHFKEDAERARRDVEDQPEEYRRAEEEGRRHSAGDVQGDAEKI